jgi:hypothetical protein
MLVRSRQVVKVPAIIVQDCVCQVAYCLRDGAPLTRARLSAKAQSEHHEEGSNLNELHAGLHCRRRVEMTLLESRLEVDIGCKNWDVGDKLSSVHGPIDMHRTCTGGALLF